MTVDDMDEALRADPSIVAFTLSGPDWFALEAHQKRTPNNEPGWGRGGLTHGGVCVFVGHMTKIWSEADWRAAWGATPAEVEIRLPRDR